MTLTAIRTLVALSIGRAMTIPFIGRAGDGGPGDPPSAWLMPLIGDALIGVSGIAILALLHLRRTPTTWTIAVVWSAVAAFDALAAYIVDVQNPWPEFFMLEAFGRSMFFLAAAMHLVIIGLLARPEVLGQFGRAHT